MAYKRPSRAGCANVSGKRAPGEVGTTNNWYKLELAKVRNLLRQKARVVTGAKGYHWAVYHAS